MPSLSLHSVLERHVVPAEVLASDKTIEVEALRADLSDLRNRLMQFFWIAAGMIVIVFALGIFLILRSLDSPGVVAALTAAMGVSVGGAVGYMRRLSRDLAQINLILILAHSLNAEHIADIVRLLAAKL